MREVRVLKGPRDLPRVRRQGGFVTGPVIDGNVEELRGLDAGESQDLSSSLMGCGSSPGSKYSIPYWSSTRFFLRNQKSAAPNSKIRRTPPPIRAKISQLRSVELASMAVQRFPVHAEQGRCEQSVYAQFLLKCSAEVAKIGRTCSLEAFSTCALIYGLGTRWSGLVLRTRQ